MKKVMADRRLLIGYVLAHLLLLFTFQEKGVFWYLFTASMLILISFSILHEGLENNASALKYLSYGILSGIAVYGLFWLGSTMIDILKLPLSGQVSQLYRQFEPKSAWHFIVLIIIIAPGEEIFWRGFVLRRLLKHLNARTSVILSSFLYASVHIYSGQFALLLAALAAGLAWGALYAWKRSIPLVVVSHIVFDLLLFVILPLR
ncbi:type II CAAX endopeptidase family protein [Bacillus sp. FJAT-27251]|uniref:CPBP family intramembrane glutamic endopeptidase n=1 Tax=Bacillus sp. FJAT-27251 TaxID=1684142 RepID=UPI0006A7E0CB|nr:type II CAAX endopeptidase family protein [Bacillus sp. FJAT-27251]